MKEWPEEGIWDSNSKGEMILASQGVRLWTAPCRFRPDDSGFAVEGVDEMTLRNLKKQRRVAFSMADSSGKRTVQGSGLIRTIDETQQDGATLRLEPYRLVIADSAEEHGVRNYERRMQGWIPVAGYAEPDVRTYAFWYSAFRAVTLPMSALPVVVGAAVALTRGYFDLPLLSMCLIGSILAHAGANAISDYYDLKNGVDLPWALSSHLGMLANERIDPEIIRSAAIICFSTVGMIGIFLVSLAGWPVLAFGVAGVAGGFFYSGGPIKYKYRAMGELWLGWLMGPLTGMGTYYVLARDWDWVAFALSLGLGMLVSSASLVNNLRDMPDDRAARIRTLPMTLGINRTKTLYYSLIVGSYISVFAAVLLETRMWPVVIVLASLPQALTAIRALRNTHNSEDDIRAKARTSPYPLYSILLHKRFATLAVVGIVIAWVLMTFTPNVLGLPLSI